MLFVTVYHYNTPKIYFLAVLYYILVKKST